MASPKIRSVGVYRSKDFTLVEVLTTKTQGERALREHPEPVVVKTYYEVYPKQLEVLSYTEASQLETIIEHARKWRNK